jgi:regulator of replication initiation timing
MKKLSLEYLKNMLDIRTKLLSVVRADLEDATKQLLIYEETEAVRELKIKAMEDAVKVYQSANNAVQGQNTQFRTRIDELLEDKKLLREQINDLIESKQALRVELAEAKDQADWWRTQDADEDYIASLEIAMLPDNISFENHSHNAPRETSEE